MKTFLWSNIRLHQTHHNNHISVQFQIHVFMIMGPETLVFYHCALYHWPQKCGDKTVIYISVGEIYIGRVLFVFFTRERKCLYLLIYVTIVDFMLCLLQMIFPLILVLYFTKVSVYRMDPVKLLCCHLIMQLAYHQADTISNY